MTREEVVQFVGRVCGDICSQLCGASKAEYSTDVNFTSNFDAHFSMYGRDAALSQASEKLYRYKNRGNTQDLIKALGWIVLLLSKDESYTNGHTSDQTVEKTTGEEQRDASYPYQSSTNRIR